MRSVNEISRQPVVISVSELTQGARDRRGCVAVDVGLGRDLQLCAGRVRALLFLAQGRTFPGALRAVSAQGREAGV